ncbi:protein S100-A14-like isoform X2 [Cyclopterus lumpus]|uniref:S100/CaBP-9k-type calcium binding subdomain domain-containing protein n=1 Tax=Cyclopterus lumpus TaxID=8103 RepID=A0A8C2X0N2_CYCLU|nr:protein S100-A14-like isoform X2 [Cyclopterus lumpus]
MTTELSDLEAAINTLVTQFHEAADDGPTMNATQFQNMICKRLPGFAKHVETEEGLGQVLDQMGVEAGQSISFENFWTLINKQAVQLFDSTHKVKNVSCGCYLM